MLQELRASLVVLGFFILLTGLAYPFFITAVGGAVFSHQANGSLIEKDGKIIGSELIGQNFSALGSFHPRPSAAGNGYDAANSSGSNLAPSAPDLIKTITARITDLRQGGDLRPVPVDFVTASASGLDPDISVSTALYQAPIVAGARGLPLHQVQQLIDEHTKPRTFGFLGEPRLNVLELNMALDRVKAVAP